MQTEGVTPAELKTTREALGLSSEWVAQVGGVAVRTVRHWEGGAALVPEDVAAVLEQLAKQVRCYVERVVSSRPQAPLTLLRFRDQQALRENTGLTWPTSTHAIAQLRCIEHLREVDGVPARLIWFDPTEYASWAAVQRDPTVQAWADVQPWAPRA